MDWHRSLESNSRRPYALAWAQLLDRMDAAVHGDAGAREAVLDRLAAFRSEPTDLDEQGGDADEHAAAAAIYAAECLESGGVEAASLAARRVTDIAFDVAEQDRVMRGGWTGKVDDFIWSSSHPSVQAELQRQLEDLAELLGVID